MLMGEKKKKTGYNWNEPGIEQKTGRDVLRTTYRVIHRFVVYINIFQLIQEISAFGVDGWCKEEMVPKCAIHDDANRSKVEQ